MTESLKKTPLNALHHSFGARMVPFAGYEMPVQYPNGILKEHLSVREGAGVFDVSHMGQIAVRAKSGQLADAARALEALVPANIVDLPEGRQRYTLLTNEAGGIMDDLMVANRGDHFALVVNAAFKEADFELLLSGLSDECTVEWVDNALIALQGPGSDKIMSGVHSDIAHMRFMDVRGINLHGLPISVSRSGYTGEDGFEISMPAGPAREFFERLIKGGEVVPVGLGARDSLRLEAGLCLSGQDIDTQTTVVEAALEWAIPPARRLGGARPGGFPGAGIILGQIAEGAERRRVGLRPEGRAPMREGTALFTSETAADPVGKITSGGFGPSLNAPVAMGYVPIEMAAAGTRLYGDLRGKRHPVVVTKLPFIEPGYRRS